MPSLAGLIPLIIVLAVLVWILVRSRQGAFGASGEVIVRCRDGHLFTTLLIPIASFKAIRLGLGRFQYCLAGELIAVSGLPIPRA